MQLGDYQLELLHDGLFKLDGGAMFGIVPKPLWSKEAPTDEKNRIPLSCRCPLIRAGKEIILIDNGLGRKWTDKQREIYAIPPEETLLTQLAGVGLKPSDITIMVLTHLHLDHAGWNTRLNAKGEPEPVFVNARHLVERRELETAKRPNEIQRGTYLPPNIAPLGQAGMFEVFDETKEIVPGVTIFRTGGHTAGNSLVRIERGGNQALFIGEMMPTTAHRHLPWVMAYDNFPMETLEVKRRLLKECVQQQTLVLLDHDPVHAAVRLREADGGKLEVVPVG
jgi:glyoxylase-like metal-dependent hydrolase (beta-lactamase superfamily II)